MEQSGQVNNSAPVNPNPPMSSNPMSVATITNAEMRIESLLEECVRTKASDLHLQVGLPPILRIDGALQPVSGYGNLDEPTVERLVFSTLEEDQKQILIKDKEFDYSFSFGDLGRFRVNAFHEKGNLAGAFRLIPNEIQSINELGMPSVVSSFADFPRGLVLVTGPTGSGKSTTLAALVDKINREKSVHIITIEDPVEYIFNCHKSIISQRQVGVDTESFSDGIKYALRQDPDVIFIGEIRDRETMAAALKASETGHLVLTTLHTNDAVQTINRIVNMFDESNRAMVRKQLAETLRATIAQKLVYSESNQKRYPACEILVCTSTIKDYINKDNTEEIYGLINDNNIDDMVSMNSSLALLASQGKITKEEALANSNDENELEKIFRGVYQGSKNYYE